MVDEPTGTAATTDDESPANPERRRLLGGATLAAAAFALGVGETNAAAPPPRATKQSSSAVDAKLREHIQHVVVLFAENRSFNNLFAAFPGLQQPLAKVPVRAMQQRDRDGEDGVAEGLETRRSPIGGALGQD